MQDIARLDDMAAAFSVLGRFHRAAPDEQTLLTLWELLGTKASSMGPQLTVEQFTRLYIAQGPEARRITSQRLRMEPAYGSREGRKDLPYEWAEVEANQITSFRSVVESIVETGNNRVTLREKD